MKFKILADVLHILHDKFEVDELDIQMIRVVELTKAHEGEARVMRVLEECSRESQTTSHNRMKRLIALGFLVKAYGHDNRVKLLEMGDKSDEMFSFLMGC